jgi:hypothetical protein
MLSGIRNFHLQIRRFRLEFDGLVGCVRNLKGRAQRDSPTQVFQNLLTRNPSLP